MESQDFVLYKNVWVNRNPLNACKMSNQKCEKMLTGGGYLVRQIYDFDCGEETSFWFIVKDKFEDFDTFPKKTQKYIKKANEKFIIDRISKERLRDQGYNVMRSACENYKVKANCPSKQEWEQRVDNMGDKYELWGCIDRDTDILQAFAICKVDGDVCNFETSKVNPEFLPKYYPMYGLYFKRNEHYLKERGMRYVISSARSITEHSNIQSFLIEKLNFRKAYCHISLYYKFPLGLIVKMIYPFRKLIKHPKISALLNMEAMARGEI